MKTWQNGRKSSISYDREFGKKYDGNLVLYTCSLTKGPMAPSFLWMSPSIR
jgi:hypothetical protein